MIAAISVIVFPVHSLLIGGVNNKSACYFIPWLILTGIFNVALLILWLVGGAILMWLMPSFVIPLFVPGGSVVVLAVYFWLVVFTHFREVKKETSEKVRESDLS